MRHARLQLARAPSHVGRAPPRRRRRGRRLDDMAKDRGKARSTTMNGPTALLGVLSPAEFAKQWAKKYNQPQLS